MLVVLYLFNFCFFYRVNWIMNCKKMIASFLYLPFMEDNIFYRKKEEPNEKLTTWKKKHRILFECISVPDWRASSDLFTHFKTRTSWGICIMEATLTTQGRSFWKVFHRSVIDLSLDSMMKMIHVIPKTLCRYLQSWSNMTKSACMQWANTKIKN